jgi:hypothetical protein
LARTPWYFGLIIILLSYFSFKNQQIEQLKDGEEFHSEMTELVASPDGKTFAAG